MKKAVIFSIIGIVVVVGAGYLYFRVINPNQAVQTSNRVSVQGVIGDIDPNSQILVLNNSSDSGINFVSADSGTKFLDENNNPVDFSYFGKGVEIQALGVKNNNSLDAAQIQATKVPNIIISSPSEGDTVGNTIIVRGKARVFESQFVIRVTSGGKEIYKNSATTSSADAGKFGDFEQEIDLDPSMINGTDLVLEAYDLSAKDGSQIDLVSVPLSYQAGDELSMKIYFNNSQMDSDFSCNKVFPVVRNIPKTLTPARDTISQLLKGPTEDEKVKGFFTTIPAGAKIQSLAIINGVANIDFNEALEAGVAGSCKVSAIRAEITQTLEQFPSVSDVLISINGNSTSTLQP